MKREKRSDIFYVAFFFVSMCSSKVKCTAKTRKGPPKFFNIFLDQDVHLLLSVLPLVIYFFFPL